MISFPEGEDFRGFNQWVAPRKDAYAIDSIYVAENSKDMHRRIIYCPEESLEVETDMVISTSAKIIGRFPSLREIMIANLGSVTMNGDFWWGSPVDQDEIVKKAMWKWETINLQQMNLDNGNIIYGI